MSPNDYLQRAEEIDRRTRDAYKIVRGRIMMVGLTQLQSSKGIEPSSKTTVADVRSAIEAHQLAIAEFFTLDEAFLKGN